jgi:error-prone DNA polymerase
VASAFDVPLLATNDPLYATRDQRPLHDIVTCIRMGTTIQKAGFALEANAERYIKTAHDMAQLFHACPEAVAETERFAAHIHFDLEQLKYEYPHEPVPGGWTPDDWLAHLVWTAAHERYGAELPEKIRKSIETAPRSSHIISSRSTIWSNSRAIKNHRSCAKGAVRRRTLRCVFCLA